MSITRDSKVYFDNLKQVADSNYLIFCLPADATVPRRSLSLGKPALLRGIDVRSPGEPTSAFPLSRSGTRGRSRNPRRRHRCGCRRRSRDGRARSVFANARTFSAVVVYTLALLALLCASAAHNCGPTRAGKDLRRRVDHAAIFVMIAFQATPVVQGESDPPSAAARLVFCRSRSTELGARFRPRFGDVETDLV